MKSIEKMILSIFLLLLISVIPTSATLHNVSGYVLFDGSGMNGVTVSDNESIDTATTNITGYYTLGGYTNQTSYIITVDDYGIYKGSSLQVDFLEADITNHNLTMAFKSLTTYMSELTSIVTALTTMFSAVMIVFMEPPLSLFIGVALFAFIVSIVGRYLMGRNK